MNGEHPSFETQVAPTIFPQVEAGCGGRYPFSPSKIDAQRETRLKHLLEVSTVRRLQRWGREWFQQRPLGLLEGRSACVRVQRWWRRRRAVVVCPASDLPPADVKEPLVDDDSLPDAAAAALCPAGHVMEHVHARSDGRYKCNGCLSMYPMNQWLADIFQGQPILHCGDCVWSLCGGCIAQSAGFEALPMQWGESCVAATDRLIWSLLGVESDTD